MNRWKHLFAGICFISMTSIQSVFAHQFLPVPFENIELAPNNSLVSSYSFGEHAIIFCFDNTLLNVGIITWTLNGSTPTSHLPIFLKTNPIFEGEFADASGLIQITNNQPQPLFISCDFGY